MQLKNGKVFLIFSYSVSYSNLPPIQDIIIAGDLNGRVKSHEKSDVVGKFAEETENNNRKRLLEWCYENELKLMNTFFEHKDIHWYTWERTSLQQKSIIDYVITKQKTIYKINDIRVKRGANCGTDHHLLVATAVYPFLKRNTQDKENDNTKKMTNQR
ncbi:hypothetical protein RN001_011783 [Aquatica leii]|uniref:Craniofacial development protein 2 n=1 Tax=Aquatica leii TaxID=1421715 RepID=A0AAN7P694_9COLE|nr:hypothetical protein RN001_011783 [Aquatica leii]